MSKPKVLVTSRLPGGMEDLLRADFDITVNPGDAYTKDELYANARGKDAIISLLVDRIDENFFDTFPEIKVVANVAVGYDNIDVEAARKRGVLVCNTPGVLTESTADLAFALMLATARKIPSSEQFLRQGQWKKFALDLLLGVDVHHKTLGIIGLGRIGQAFANRARGFSMNILYSQPRQAPAEVESPLQAKYVSLEELLAQSDFVSVHCPLNAATKHTLSTAQFKLMKPSAILINTARGAVIDEPALATALEQRVIAAAGLDVFEAEPQLTPKLLELDNVVLLPHIGSATIETRTAMGKLAVDAIINAFKGISPANLVNKESWPQFQSRRQTQNA
jgi:glyoxylate reductase